MAISYDVTVVIPAFNSVETLPRAMKSVLRQDLRDFEVLVVDDGSTDATAQVARAVVTDPRVTVISLSTNRGKPYAMNTGIGEARGRWIAVLDADDWYAPSRLSTLVATGDQADVPLVADNQFLYDEGADQIVRTAFADMTGGIKLDQATFVAGCDPYADFDFGMLKPLVRTSFIRQVNLQYRENARLSEDFLYLLEFFAAGGEGFLVPHPLYYWRQAFGSLSRHWTYGGGGAWRYDFLSGARASEEVLPILRQNGQRVLARMLKERIRAFYRLHRLQQVSQLRANGASPVELAARVALQPSIWPLIAQRSVRRLGRKQCAN
jgi:glycosyltransferase involved in cell wall biosynthesis